MKRIETRKYEFEGKVFSAEVTRRFGIIRTTISFGKVPDTIKVTAPLLMSMKEIDSIVMALLPKLMKKYDRFYKFPYGDNWIYILGEKKEMAFQNEDERKKYLLKIAKPLFEERLRHYEEAMGVSKPYRLSVRSMRTRFGSNSRSTYRISLALELIHFDVSVIDSVVVHELSHHFHFDHGKGFYDLVLRFCPNYFRLRQVLLKKDYEYHVNEQKE